MKISFQLLAGIGLSAFLLFSNCSKTELPAPVMEDPIFEVSSTFDGSALRFTAGQGGLYHFTKFKTDAAHDVLVFSGAFAPADCPESDCPRSLRFELRNIVRGGSVSMASLGQSVRNFISPDSAGGVNLGQVDAQWIDEQGLVWRSDKIAQAADAHFTIKSKSDFAPNERGEQTVKLDISFRCLLATATESRLFSGYGVIAVAVP